MAAGRGSHPASLAGCMHRHYVGARTQRLVAREPGQGLDVPAAGFNEVYGDYGEAGITNEGKTIANWGEGFSWTGPGGVWFNRKR
jgi:hypothetical protein